jgi:glycosyltransferase involved in cell wall biosynthesis
MKRFKNSLVGIFVLMQSLILANPIEFEIIIPSYNNERWCVGNLLSAVRQKYPLFHITYINDCSTDATGTLVDAFIQAHNLQDKITVIHNTERKGALENLYNAIHACEDHKVIVTLDGDDMLAHDEVLHRLESIYANYNVWITYGQFQEWPNGRTGFCEAMPTDIVKKNAFRSHPNLPSHLRTFYAWLFKKIKRDDLVYRGTFYEMTWDQAMMYPMMEMAGERHAFIPDVLYHYNAINSISDHRVNKGLQGMLAQVIRSKNPYTRLPAWDATVKHKLYTPPAPKPAMTHKEKREYYKQVKKALKQKLNL